MRPNHDVLKILGPLTRRRRKVDTVINAFGQGEGERSICLKVCDVSETLARKVVLSVVLVGLWRGPPIRDNGAATSCLLPGCIPDSHVGTLRNE